MTKREVAYALFEEGKSPSSPEVKALKLKAQTRANYYWEWKRGRGEAKYSRAHGGESVGGIDETKGVRKEANTSPKAETEEETPVDEAEDNELEEDEEAIPEEGEESTAEKSHEGIGEVDEVGGKVKKKGEEGKEGKGKYEVTVAGQGIRCVVYLSLQTLALYEIAAAKQAQLSGDGAVKLTLGDYLDNCSEQFFKDRKLKLGLVEI